jgi:4,5-DOPA dioxygenase extradiol
MIIPTGQGTFPVMFVGHGSPMNAIEDNNFSREWRKIAAGIPKPEAILCISAHWETRGTLVTAMKKPKTIHDFGGFPRQLYEVIYPAPGNPVLAEEITKSVSSTEVRTDEDWGLDHGTWSVIRNMYPAADIPVIQMSLDYTKKPQHHFDLAKELIPLRNKGILIIGSGNIVHNLGMVAWDKMNEPDFGFDWALEASDKIKKLIHEGDHRSLVDYQRLGRSVSMAIPTPEHFLPLLYVLALKSDNETFTLFNDEHVMGSLTMTSLISSGS